MPQGNEFGRSGGKWMPESKLKQLFRAGLTYDEIANVNESTQGWRPTRSAVQKKYKALGMPPRYSAHTNLLPWKVKMEHVDSTFRNMLEAESRHRQGRAESDFDRKMRARMPMISGKS